MNYKSMSVEEILEKLIGFNTVNDQDNQLIMKWLADFLLPLGFKIQLIKNSKSKKVVLLAKYNKRKPVLTFCGHTDTVPASSDWTKDPFKLTNADGKFYGLGSCDMKGGIAAFLTAISQTDLAKLKKGLNLLFTYDEEKNFSGIKDFVKKVKLKSKYIVLAEPTNLTPVIASKGVVALRVQFLGKASHGSLPENGINAIIGAMQFIGQVQKYFAKIQVQKNDLFPKPTASLNIAKISGGNALNIVPKDCCLELEYRTINQKQTIQIYQDLLEILRQNCCQFNLKLTLQTPLALLKNKKFIRVLEELTQKPAKGANYSTEAAYLSKAGYDCAVLGPGGGMEHQADEYINQTELNQAVIIYKKIIQKFCQ